MTITQCYVWRDIDSKPRTRLRKATSIKSGDEKQDSANGENYYLVDANDSSRWVGVIVPGKQNVWSNSIAHSQFFSDGPGDTIQTVIGNNVAVYTYTINRAGLTDDSFYLSWIGEVNDGNRNSRTCVNIQPKNFDIGPWFHIEDRTDGKKNHAKNETSNHNVIIIATVVIIALIGLTVLVVRKRVLIMSKFKSIMKHEESAEL